MATLANATQILRSPGDPRIESSGPSSLTGVDRLARALGWFSFALGAAELAAPRRIAGALGLEGKERLVRAYGAREIAAGIPTLSYDKHVGLISRIVGDVVDIATLAPALRAANPKRKNAVFAMGAVGVVTLLDIAAAAGVKVLVLSHFVPADATGLTAEKWADAVRPNLQGRSGGGARSDGNSAVSEARDQRPQSARGKHAG